MIDVAMVIVIASFRIHADKIHNKNTRAITAKRRWLLSRGSAGEYQADEQ